MDSSGADYCLLCYGEKGGGDCSNTWIDDCTALMLGWCRLGLHSALLIGHRSLCGVARRIGARFGDHLIEGPQSAGETVMGTIEADVYGEGPGTPREAPRAGQDC